jgi:hypothetical protein
MASTAFQGIASQASFLEAPPVGEGGDTNVFGGEFLGNLVGL